MGSARLAAGDALRIAADRVLDGADRARLAAASRALSARYRGPAGPRSSRNQDREAAAEAYVAVRFPATFAAVSRVLGEGAELDPGFEPETQLDLGTGTGAAAWAAESTWPGLRDVTLLDADPRMIQLGRRLREADPRPNPRSQDTILAPTPDPPPFSARYSDPRSPGTRWTWIQDDFVAARLAPHDLVVASYVFGELDPDERLATANAAWTATQGQLVIVEPGTPAGFATIREIRSALIDSGAELLAPCPHNGQCPMSGADWCHFAVRVQRSALHRRIKEAELAYEDEKFSYVIFTRRAASRASGRILRHPVRRPKKIDFQVCTDSGVRPISVAKSNPSYKHLKKLGWGDELPDDLVF